jgi:hypothetical protein
LDVNLLGKTKLNRQELRDSNAVHTSNVSQQEKTLFSAFEKAKKEQISAHNSTDASAGTPLGNKKRDGAEMAWNAERDKNEPEQVRLFRSSLSRNPGVAQIFDPWFMDVNTHDKTAAVANVQLSSNERLHSHHLHARTLRPYYIVGRITASEVVLAK